MVNMAQLGANIIQDSYSFTDKKFQDFSRSIKTFFQDLLRAHQRLNIKTNSSDLL